MNECVVQFTTPVEYRDGGGPMHVRHEEDAVTWLWAFPQLVCWPRPLEWLYTPVVGNRRWPGDLWGIDDGGELLILECKQCRRRDDPFADFLRFHQPDREELTASHWKRKFSLHLAAELKYANGMQERPRGRTAGILPRSNRRTHLRRWPELVAMIDSRIRDSAYATTVSGYLEVRAKAGNPIPNYLAYIIQSRETMPVLTPAALTSARGLQARVGPERVGLLVVMATRSPEGTLSVRAVRSQALLAA